MRGKRYDKKSLKKCESPYLVLMLHYCNKKYRLALFASHMEKI